MASAIPVHVSVEEPPMELRRRLGGHIPQLDGLRGVAIALVLVTHSFAFGPHDTTSPLPRALIALGEMGWIGVDLFFVLSGFLITGILLDSRGFPGWLRSFYARRVLRIFPLYYAFIALAVIGGSILAGSSHEQAWLVRHQLWFFGYLQNWLYVRDGWHHTPVGTGHTWSLAIEEQFYLAWPFIVALVGGGRRLICTCAALVVGAIAFRCWLVGSGGNDIGPYVATLARVDTLVIGAALAAFLRTGPRVEVVRAAARPIVLLLVPLLVAAMASFGTRGPWMLTGGFTAVAIAAAAAVAFAVASDRGAVSRALASRPLTALGKYSYAIYLLHGPVFGTAGNAWKRHLSPTVGSSFLWQGVFLTGCLAITWLLAIVSWRFFESPILSLKRYFPTPRPPAAITRDEAAVAPAAVAG